MNNNIVGQKFNQLTVISKTANKADNGAYYWLCQCDCGGYTEATKQQLNKSYKKSCGCLIQKSLKNLGIGWKTKCKKCGIEFITKSCKQVYCSHACSFLDRVDTSQDCHTWLGNKNTEGYGVLVVNKKTVLAHRYSYEYYNKTKIPKDLVVCHTCDNPSCVNPNHMFLGTRGDNNTDRSKKGRSGKRVFTEGEKQYYSKITKGSNNGFAKLTEEIALLIFNENLSRRALAEKYNVSKSCIDGIKLKRTWKHIHENIKA